MATTKKEFAVDNLHGYKRIHWNWESDSSGAVSNQTEFTYDGMITDLTTKPGSGSDAPTTLYDVYINDEDGFDILNGQGVDRSATLQEHKGKVDGLGTVLHSKLTLVVANAGDITKGQCRIDLV